MEVINVRLAEPAVCGGDTVPTLVMWSCVPAKRRRTESASGATVTTIGVSANAAAQLRSRWISSDPMHWTGWARPEGVTITERRMSRIFGHSVCCDKRREEERSSQPVVAKPQRLSTQSDRATLLKDHCAPKEMQNWLELSPSPWVQGLNMLHLLQRAFSTSSLYIIWSLFFLKTKIP